MTERITDHKDIAAEQAIAGTILRHGMPALLWLVDFDVNAIFELNARAVVNAALDTVKGETGPDILDCVGTALGKSGHLDVVGGFTGLLGMEANGLGNPSGIVPLLERVTDLWAKRSRMLAGEVGDTGFKGAAHRLHNEASRRAKLVSSSLSFGVPYLDDYCRALMPHDLVLIGARTGAGKTTLAQIIATTNALAGKRVHYFALEAEPDELERHLKYQWISKRMFAQCVPGREGLNYPDWYRGVYDDAIGTLSAEADAAMAVDYATLSTFYKEKDFTHEDITTLFLAIRNETDLIVLDHLHYVDTPQDSSENRAQKEIVKVLRDCALAIGVPIVVVAHLRKRFSRKTLLPDLDDFMGSSDITKIATRAILIAPALDQHATGCVRPTYMTVAKDRLCGGSQMVALLGYDLRTGLYERLYALGYMDMMGEKFSFISDQPPRWAQHARMVTT